MSATKMQKAERQVVFLWLLGGALTTACGQSEGLPCGRTNLRNECFEQFFYESNRITKEIHQCLGLTIEYTYSGDMLVKRESGPDPFRVTEYFYEDGLLSLERSFPEPMSETIYTYDDQRRLTEKVTRTPILQLEQVHQLSYSSGNMLSAERVFRNDSLYKETRFTYDESMLVEEISDFADGTQARIECIYEQDILTEKKSYKGEMLLDHYQYSYDCS